MTDNLLVFTTGNTDQLALLRQSCAHVGIDLVVYNENGPWYTHGRTKIVDALAFLKTRSEPYAMFVDGHDSLIVDPSEMILDNYRRRFGDSIVASVEPNCWPHPGLAPELDRICAEGTGESVKRYLNSGGWIGRRLYLIDALERMVGYATYDWPDHDQRCWQQLLIDGYDVQLDYYCHIFQCMNSCSEIGADLFNTRTNTFPSVFHFNGRTGTDGRAEAFYGIVHSCGRVSIQSLSRRNRS